MVSDPAIRRETDRQTFQSPASDLDQNKPAETTPPRQPEPNETSPLESATRTAEKPEEKVEEKPTTNEPAEQRPVSSFPYTPGSLFGNAGSTDIGSDENE